MFLMSFQIKKSRQYLLRIKKHQYFSIVSLPTDSVIIDHAIVTYHTRSYLLTMIKFN
jgi:hypothetical protein